MELDELESLSKNDFLPLIPLIKQEQLDPIPAEMNVERNLLAGNTIDPATTASTSLSTSSSLLSSISNPCDSMEKRVRTCLNIIF